MEQGPSLRPAVRPVLPARVGALKDVPIVAVTSCAIAGDRERAIEAGCAGTIEKPMTPEAFPET